MAIVDVEASVSGEASTTAGLTLFATLAASVSGDASTSALLKLLAALETSVSGDASASASELLDAAFASVSGEADATAAINVSHPLVFLGNGDASTNLSIEVAHSLSASLTPDASVALALTVFHPLAASVSGDADATVPGLLDAAFSTTGGDSDIQTPNLFLTLGPNALLQGEASISAPLEKLTPISVSLSGDADLTADLEKRRPINCSVGGEAFFVGLLSTHKGLAASVSSTANATATIRKFRLINVDVSGDANFTGSADKFRAGEAVLSAESELAADVNVFHSLFSSVSGDAALIGSGDVDTVIFYVEADLSGDASCTGAAGGGLGVDRVRFVDCSLSAGAEFTVRLQVSPPAPIPSVGVPGVALVLEGYEVHGSAHVVRLRGPRTSVRMGDFLHDQNNHAWLVDGVRSEQGEVRLRLRPVPGTPLRVRPEGVLDLGPLV